MPRPGLLVAAVLGQRERVNDEADDEHPGHDADDDEEVVDLVGLLGKGGVGVETRRARRPVPVRPYSRRAAGHGGGFLFSRWRGRRGGGGGGSSDGPAVVDFQFHLAEAQRLAGFENGLGNLSLLMNVPLVEPRSLTTISLPRRKDFAVMAGDGRVGDLKRVVLDAADGGAIRVQFMRATGHALSQDNKFGHRLR